MNSRKWMRKALSTCLTVATIATSSMITLANSEKITGELLTSNGAVVRVNGEAAQNGRSIFSSSTIVTSENSGAILNLGKAGKIELAPDTNLTLSFDEKGMSGSLLAGRVTALNVSEKAVFQTIDGTTANLSAGESVAATTNKAQDDDAAGNGGSAWIAWAAVLGGAAVGIILAATSDNNRTAIGGGSNVISPTR